MALAGTVQDLIALRMSAWHSKYPMFHQTSALQVLYLPAAMQTQANCTN